MSAPKLPTICLLTDSGAPLFGYYLDKIINAGLVVDCIIVNNKVRTREDLARHEQRTGGKMPPLPHSLYENSGIHFHHVDSHSSNQCIEFIKFRHADIVCNVGTTQILKGDVFSSSKLGFLNCHPGILPQFRGCTCVEWAIYLDEQVGNTVHFMDEGIDSGPIVCKEAIHFTKDDRYSDVRRKVYEHATDLMTRGIKQVIADEMTVHNTPPQGDGRYFKVMGDEKLQAVKVKLLQGKYKYQL